MSKNRKSVKKWTTPQGNKKVDNTEEVSSKIDMVVNIGNHSPQYPCDSRVSGHSTPIHKRDYTFDAEDSHELNYRYSPISLPCTQDGGNEVAWDWQISIGKNSNENSKAHGNCETPKQTKKLQKKRNSNSPLLQKPLKRKLVKMENIENIGKLTAELKALTEKMKNIQQNCDNHTTVIRDNIKHEHETKLLTKLDDKNTGDIMLEVGTDNDKPKIEIITIDSNDKKVSNYEDLFDDSIDDSMVKCSQEIEKKLNLCKDTGNDGVGLSIISEEKELCSTLGKEEQYLITSSNFIEISKNSNTSKNSSLATTNSYLKTYSNNSSKTNSTGSASILNSKDASFQKSHINNSVMSAQNRKIMLQRKDMSEFPDDSFDDCLATCMEDDKLLSKLSEYDFTASNTGSDSSHSNKMSKQTISNSINNKKTSNTSASKTGSFHNAKSNSYENSKLISNDLVEDISALNYKEMIQKSFTSNNTLENRKFFKTKSLSDHYFYQSRMSNVNNKISNIGSSSEKRFQSNSVSSSVSTTFPIVNSQNPYGSNKFPSINDVENTHTLNRLEEKETGSCIIKYKSTSNLCNVKEMRDTQSITCTPAEIEKKRQEAKMRLEAKRKLQQGIKIAGTPSDVPVTKSVKR